ncbi:D-aminoacylase [subsurface metagenome]
MKKKILFGKRYQVITGMVLVFALFIVLILSAVAAGPGSEFDIIIKNGLVFDGTGKAGYKADIGIADGKIVAIGAITLNQTATVIDADGDIVAPGFIDMHSHADKKILELPTAENLIFQGITSVLGGNCGGSKWPIGEFLKEFEAKGTSLNVAMLVGHGNIRRAAMKDPDCVSTDAEILVMQDLVEQAMKEGAFGISTGLEYMPGRMASTEELIALAKRAGQFGGIFTSHMRCEDATLLNSVREIIEIGAKSGTPVEISHWKAAGAEQWGQGKVVSAMLLTARALGVDITADQYPYNAMSCGLGWEFPAWALKGGTDPLVKRLADPALYDRIWKYVRNHRKTITGEDMSNVIIARYNHNPDLEGKTFAEVLIDRGLEPTLDNGTDLIIELHTTGGCSVIDFAMDEDDIKVIMRNPYVMVGSDSAVREFGKGSPHPRNYGAFPRMISHYINDQFVLTLEEAIRKMTSLPAERISLEDRGVIKEGNWADIVIFDELAIKDTATFANPHQYPEGIHYVIVNGVVTADHGRHTGAKAGMALYGPATIGKD